MNLTILLDMAADAYGDRVLVGDVDEGITAAGLRDRSDTGAALIHESGADALVYLAINGPAFPVALFASARAGVPLVPLNYRLGTEQLDGLLANHPGALAIVDEHLIGSVERAGLSWLSPAEWLAKTAVEPAATPVDSVTAEQPTAVIIYTSGTTSTPKGVLLGHSNLTSYVISTVEFAHAAAGDATLISVPPYHIAGVSNVLSNLYAGRRTLVLEGFTAARWLSLIHEQRITNAMVVPTMLARIMDADPAELASASSLRSLAYGGARMPQRVIEKALRTWPWVDFVNAYGLTETSSTISVLGPDEHRSALAADDPAQRARLSSAGQLVPGIELKIRDEDGASLPAGSPGQIWVRGEQVSGQYAGKAPSLDADGYFYTRDHGYLDNDGFLFVEGRVDDTIIRGAENIAPEEVEDVLLRHPDVVDAAVVGIPDDEWGQRIEAVLVLRAGAATDPDGLKDHVRSALRSSKTPEQITFWTELPRTATGKLLRRDVAAALSRAVSG